MTAIHVSDFEAGRYLYRVAAARFGVDTAILHADDFIHGGLHAFRVGGFQGLRQHADAVGTKLKEGKT